MTLLEGVVHVCKAENVRDEREAHRQLKAALVEGDLWPLKWEKERGDRVPPFGYTPAVTPTDTPPRGHAWLEANINWKSGKVRDDWSEHKYAKWRVLLFHRLTVLRHWPSPLSNLAAPVSANANNLGSRRKRGPKTEKFPSIVAAMTADIEKDRAAIEKLRAMTDKELVKTYGDKAGAKRTVCRRARDVVLSEFDAKQNSVK
jgi:hypothetical protein